VKAPTSSTYRVLVAEHHRVIHRIDAAGSAHAVPVSPPAGDDREALAGLLVIPVLDKAIP
jgi:hypothetical protein